MRVRKRAPTPQPQPIIPAVAPGSSSAFSAPFDSYLALSTQLREHNLQMTAHFQRLEQRVDNDLHHIGASIRYLQTCVDDTYSRNAWPAPLPSSHSRPLSLPGPPFKARVPPSVVPDALAPPKDPDFHED